jgi:hypothetical protein
MLWLTLLIQYPIVVILLTEQVYSEAGVPNLVHTSLKKWKPLIRIVEHLRTNPHAPGQSSQTLLCHDKTYVQNEPKIMTIKQTMSC